MVKVFASLLFSVLVLYSYNVIEIEGKVLGYVPDQDQGKVEGFCKKLLQMRNDAFKDTGTACELRYTGMNPPKQDVLSDRIEYHAGVDVCFKDANNCNKKPERVTKDGCTSVGLVITVMNGNQEPKPQLKEFSWHH